MITTRQQLKAYALRALGSGVIQINVSDEQVEDRIDEALQYFYEFHGDGSSRVLLKHKVTQADLDSDTITVPDDIIAVLRVLPQGSFGMNALSLDYVAYITDFVQNIVTSPNGLSSYVQMQSYMNTMNNILSPDKNFVFNKYGSTIKFDGSMKPRTVEGDFLILECYVLNNPVDYPRIYNDLWFKKFVTALIKKQWANNLIKYKGFELPSGITIDGTEILQEANADIEKCMEELRNIWEEPLEPMMA